MTVPSNRFVKLLLTTILCLYHFIGYSQDVNAYLPANLNYNDNIPKPHSYLGFGIGERHIRHDQMLGYLQQVATHSERVNIEEMGRTTEFRSQVLLTISSPKNLQNIDGILTRRAENTVLKNDPMVVWLGYSVHGDEISGTNAAMVIAYYLAAAKNDTVIDMLDDLIVVIEPCINPDGMDRFVNWVTTHRGITENSDANHIEHHQGWRTGRTNHFGFDLNRDWLLLSQQESQNRISYFHKYQPNVLGDFHEMGANSSYFFQPGVPSRTHPLTPQKNTQLTRLLAKYHAQALDKKQRLYYSEEDFDDFYYGKGSTYPDINGGVGVLFEQASSRGLMQNTDNGLLTFEYGIENHVLTSLSTIEGTWKNKEKFKEYRQHFYQEAQQAAKDEDFNGYIFTELKDINNLQRFLAILAQHNIKVYQLNRDLDIKGDEYLAKRSYYIPLAQRQYRVIKALFNQQKNFQDNTFYDVSGWTLPLAMNIKFAKLTSTRGLKTTLFNKQKMSESIDNNLHHTAYAYIFEWYDFLAPKLLNKIVASGIKAKVATKEFSSIINNKNIAFNAGSIVIPSTGQTIKNWREQLVTLANDNGIQLYSVTTGLTIKGVDLGSRSFQLIKQPKILMIGGRGTSQYEAAEMLYYIDKLMAIPVTVVEMSRLDKIDLNQYSHVVMVDGKYSQIQGDAYKNFASWLTQGGVVIAQKGAAQWLAQKELLDVDFVNKEDLDQLFDTQNLRYGDKEKLAARKRIAGAIFQVNIDLTHPLAYGYQAEKIPIFRNSTIIMKQFDLPFISVAKYSETPLLSGYSDQNIVNLLTNSPSLVTHNVSKGRVIASGDTLAFRGYFTSSMKIIANSLFFANVYSSH